MPVLIDYRSFIGVSRPDGIKSFLHHFPSCFGRCSIYGTPTVCRVNGFVLYTELLLFEG